MLLAIATILIVSARCIETADESNENFEQGKSFPLVFICFAVFARALSLAQSSHVPIVYVRVCVCL